MWHSLLLALSLLAIPPFVAKGSQEPSESGSDAGSQSEVILTELHNAVYPKRAQNAAIQGEVDLKLQFEGDGTIESVDFVPTANPLLVKAAIEGVRASHFERKNCLGTTSYSLTFEFQIVASDPEQFCKARRSSQRLAGLNCCNQAFALIFPWSEGHLSVIEIYRQLLGLVGLRWLSVRFKDELS